MKILMLSHSNGGGGAGRATERLFRALDGQGADLRMHVDFKHGDDPRVEVNGGPLAQARRRVRITVDEVPAVLARHPDPSLFSPATMSAITARRVKRRRPDIVDVHWINFGYLSIRQLGRIAAPTVWHMHDMWAFTGGENYAPDSPDARWRSGYTTAKDPAMRWDVERWVFGRKTRHWHVPRTLIASSSWMADLASESPLTQHWPVHVIPNPVDTNAYSPGSVAAARDALGLPQGVPLAVALLPTRLDDPRKGFDLLRAALVVLADTHPEVRLAVVGHAQPPADWGRGLPATHWLGRQDDAGCVEAYRAADVVVVPSRQDNSPQTATEALSCGTPVVAFHVSGLPDFVTDKSTGRLVQPEDPASLAAAIAWVLEDPSRRQSLGAAARANALASWSPSVVARRHIDLYEHIHEAAARPRTDV